MDYLQPATSEADHAVRAGAHTLVLKRLPTFLTAGCTS